MRILIIDDSRFTRALLRRDLGEDADVTEASDGREGISVLTAGSEPDLILCDLQMPHMNGFEFVKAAREWGYAGPIVVCTANTQASVEHRIRELGATEFVPKPDLLTPGCARDLVARLMEGAAPPVPRRPSVRSTVSGEDGLPGHGGIELLADLLAAFSSGMTGAAAAAAGAVPLGRVEVRIPDAVLGSPSFALDLRAAALPEGIAADDPDRDVLVDRVCAWLKDAFVARFREACDRDLAVSGFRVEGTDAREAGRRPTVARTSELLLEGAAGPGQLTLTLFPDVLEEWCPAPRAPASS